MCHEYCSDCPLIPESHTTKEWAEMPDRVSVKNKWYAVSDYRTDNDVNIPRFKFGDGVTLISKLPFVTAAITDNDVEYWDEKQDAPEKKKEYPENNGCGFDEFSTIIL